MTIVSRQVVEGRQGQGEDERVAYSLTTTPWGTLPSSPVVKIYDITSGARTDVSSTCLSGSASVVDNVVLTPLVIALTAGRLYRMEIKFVSGGNTFEPYVEIAAEH